MTTIIRNPRENFHHLTDTRVVEIITKVNILRESGNPRVEGMKRIAFEAGCSLDTVYKIYRSSQIELKEPDSNGTDYIVVSIEHCSDAAVNRRKQNKIKSLSNNQKINKAYDFINRCLDYIKVSKLHTIDEAIHVIGKDYNGSKICTKTLYNYVNSGEIKGLTRFDLPRAVRWKTKKNYKEYTSKDSRGTSILERPENINSRAEFGHWEGDLVVGPRDGENGAYLTLIERQTRFYLMIPVKNKKSLTILTALKRYKRKNKAFSRMFKSITFDNGVEFSRWKEMEFSLNIKTYFGRPYHSCDRGSNENCNGMIRRYIKKGTNINTIDKKETRKINIEINEKRRKLFNYESASSVFFKQLSKEGIEFTTIYP